MQQSDYILEKDTTLCSLAAAGDMSAVEALYRRHYALMLNYGMKYCDDRELIEDCIQDLFVRLCSRPEAFAGVTYVRAYLLMALRNLIFDRLSGASGQVSLDDIPFTTLDLDRFIQFEAEGCTDEETRIRRKLVRILRHLSGRQRMVLYLHYYHGMSHKELAVMMKMEPQSSMNLLSRALAKIRRMLLMSFITLI